MTHQAAHKPHRKADPGKLPFCLPAQFCQELGQYDVHRGADVSQARGVEYANLAFRALAAGDHNILMFGTTA
jgi:hypothetical protein